MNRIQYILLLSYLFTACTPEKSQVKEIAEPQDGFIVLSQKQVLAAGIKTETVKKELLVQSVTVKGFLDVPPNNRAEVSSYIGGYVRDIKVLIGQKIKKGDVLAVLDGPELFQLQQSYIDLKSQLKYLKDDYDRMKKLFEEKVSARKDFLKSEADYFSAKADFDSNKQLLGLMGVSLQALDDGEISGRLFIKSPIDGEVTDVFSVIGEFIEPSMPLFEIVNPQHLHVELMVYEGDLSKIKEGQRASFILPQFGNEKYDCEIYLISSVIEEVERFANVHAHIEAESPDFRIGSYVEADIITDQKEVRAVSENSVIMREGKSYVFVATIRNENEYLFEQKEVAVGESGGGWVEISGLDENTRYVSEGMYFLNAQ